MATTPTSGQDLNQGSGSGTGSGATGRGPLITIFLTVFIDLVGFGIIIPITPYLATQFKASNFELGLLLAVYSAAQFLFSPFWGSLSDRIGRRPVLLMTIAGGFFSYVLFAFSNSLWVLIGARALAGAFGGNISTANAYIADITGSKDRSKAMGLIGAAFGLGFIFGPLIGGALGILGQKLGSAPPLGLSLSALGAAALCLVNLVFAAKFLPESLPLESRRAARARRSRFSEISSQIKRPIVGKMIVVYFLSGLSMAQMEAMLIKYVADRFQWGLETVTYGFVYIGAVMVFTQGYLVRKWMPKFGEPWILALGTGLFALSLFGIALSTSTFALGITMTVLALGNGLMRPPNLGIISLLTPDSEQGVAMGVTNSVASLGRILGPLIGGYLYDVLGRGSPFYSAGLFAGLALLIVLSDYKRLPASGRDGAVNV